MPQRDRRVASGCPVLPFDWVWDEGETIWPCPPCAPWHVELYEGPDIGALMVREWHAVGCRIWAEVENLGALGRVPSAGAGRHTRLSPAGSPDQVR